MAYHRTAHSSARAASIRPRREKRSSRHEGRISVDAFIASVYLPQARLIKKSWDLDERVARQHISPAFGSRAFAEIAHYEVENWLQSLLQKGLKLATVNRILAVFKHICSIAVIHRVMTAEESPCYGVRAFKVHMQRARFLSEDEAQRIKAALERYSRPEAIVLLLLLLTGARKSEILKARWEYVDLKQQMLMVPDSKSGKPRYIRLSVEAAAIIAAIPRTSGSPWLFPGRTPDKPLSDVYRFWNKIRRPLGLQDVRVHDFRHTFASWLVNAGHSLYEVQTLLGHDDPRTTMRYSHLGQASLLAATQTVSAFLFRQDRNGSMAAERPHRPTLKEGHWGLCPPQQPGCGAAGEPAKKSEKNSL